MADRTADKIYDSAPNAGVGSYIIADGVSIGIGALVQLQGGYLNHWDETDQFVGIFLGGDDRLGDGVYTGETSDTKPPRGRVDESGVIIRHIAVAGTATQAKVGDLVYCADSDLANVTLTDTTNPPVGWLREFRSASDCDIQLFSANEWKAGDAGAAWAS